jgi:hypothetical protein
MTISDDLALKKVVLYLDGNSLTLQRADPANSDEEKELQELDEKGLSKVLVIDTSASFIADKGMLQKLIETISNGDRLFSAMADRSQESHSLVQIYASHIWMRKYGLTAEQYQELVREEDLMLEDYRKPRGK